MLGGDEKFAGESGFARAAPESFFGREQREIGVVVLLRHVRENKIASAGVEPIGIGKILADGIVGEMTGAREDALLNDPRIRADLEHIEIVVGFEN